MKKPIRILIVEDEAVVAETARIMLRSMDYHIVAKACNVDKAIEVLSSRKVDIALLDINLGKGKDGIQLANKLNAEYRIPFVFLTAYADKDTIERVKVTNPGSFVVKPFTKEQLYSAIEITLANWTPVERNIILQDGRLQIKVNMDDILWLKSDNVYVEVVTESKRHVLRIRIEQQLDKLPKGQFVRTHQSYAVNAKQVNAVNSQYLMVGNEKIPISRKYRKEILNLFS